MNLTSKIDTFVAALTRSSVRHARSILLVSWIVAIAAALIAFRLPIRSDFAHLLPPNAPAVTQLRRLERRTQVLADFLVGIESADPIVREQAAVDLRARIDSLDKRLISGVTADQRVLHEYIWNNRFLFAPLADLVAARDALARELDGLNPWSLHLEDDEVDATPDSARRNQLEYRLHQMKAELDDPGETLSSDKHLQLIIVRTTFPADDSARGQRLAELLQSAAHATEQRYPAVSVGMAGDVIVTRAEHRALLGGILASILVTITLVLGALLLFYRSLPAVGALTWSLCVGVLLTFAFTKLTIGQLNLASAFLSSIVIGNGINFGLIMTARYIEARRTSPSTPELLVEAAVRSAPGTLTAAVAAAVAYGSLALTQFRGFRDFGMIGAIGMLLCWLSAYTVLPAGLQCMGSRVKWSNAAWLSSLFGRVTTRRRTTSLVAVGFSAFVVTGLASVYYVTHDPFEDDLRNLRATTPDLGEATRWMRKFDKAFGNGLSGGFAIGVEQRTQAPDVVKRLRLVDQGKPVRARLFSRIRSLDDLLPEDQSSKLAVLADIRHELDAPQWKHAPAEVQRRLQQLRPPETLRALTDEDVPEEVAFPFIERDGTRGRLILANTGLGVNTWRLSSLQSFAKQMRALKLGPQVLIGGSAFVYSDMFTMMRSDGPWASCCALVGCACIVLMVLGSGRYGLVALSSAALGILGMLSVACALRIKVNFLDFVALPITIGIGVDYAVNIAARARQLSSLGGGREAVIKTGPVVVLCSYTTIVGYGALLFSLNRGIRSFGLCAMVGELTCLTSALIIVPAYLDWSRRDRCRNIATEVSVVTNG